MGPVQVNIDFSALAGLIVTSIIDGLRQLFSPIPVSFEEWMLHSIQGILGAEGGSNLLTHVPLEWTSQNPDVLRLWRDGLAAQLALAALVIVIQGFRVAHGKEDVFTVVFRVGFFVMVGVAMAMWADMVLNMVNSASNAVGQIPLDIRAENLPNDLTLGVMLIFAAFFAALAWIKGAVGVVFIDVLIVVGPYFFILSALPIFEGLGKWWVEEFTTWSLRAFMVALVLRLGLGLAVVNTGGMQLLFAIVAFWLAWTMDSRIRRFSVGAWGSIGQLGMLNRGAAMAASAFTGGGAGATGAAGARAAAPAAAAAGAAATP